MIETSLLISLGYLVLISFCNEQLESTAWTYALKEPRFNNCYNTERFQTLRKSSCNFHYNQTVLEIKLLIKSKKTR